MENKSFEVITKDILDKKTFLETFSLAKQVDYILVMSTDQFEILKSDDSFNLQEKAEKKDWYQKALEIRVFNKDEEHKWFRCSIDKLFSYRVIKDEKTPNEEEYWDEYQYLDIDLKKSKAMSGDFVCATGGGVYRLPLSELQDLEKTTSAKEILEEKKEKVLKDVKIRVRNYLDYEESTGQLYISDWRVVELKTKEMQ